MLYRQEQAEGLHEVLIRAENTRNGVWVQEAWRNSNTARY